MINMILCLHKKYAKTYVDDILIFLKIFEKHFIHFKAIFKILLDWNIHFKAVKCFIDYLKATLLDLKMNIFEIRTDENRIKIIMTMKFLKMFKQLKTYLKMMKYLCFSISLYAQKADVLQNLKTSLFYQFSTFKNVACKEFSIKTEILNLAENELTSFNVL